MASLAQQFRNVGRLSQIINTFARYGFQKELQNAQLGEFVAGLNEQNKSNAESVQNQTGETLSSAQRLAMALEELGPTFVKLGQLLASREDVLPRSFVTELKRLQDRAKPFSRDVLDKILSEEFEGKEKDLFAEIFDPPLGAASIGQVHLARLVDGRKVVIKVQRPEIENLIRSDLSILKSLANLLENIIPEVRLLRPSVVVEELSRSLHAELDYFREASNTERMRAHFEGHEKVYVPGVYREVSSKHVLCLEAIDGQKLSSLRTEVNRTELVRTGVRAFLDMTFKYGMFHADLHPGNFIHMPDGKLAIIDFGLTARLTRDTRNTLLFMFLALVREDYETFSRLFTELTESKSDTDLHAIQSEVRDAVEAAFNLPLRELQVGKLLMQVARTAAGRNAPVSRELVLFFRALIALESFGKSLDPNFEIIKEAVSYAKGLPGTQLNRKFLEQESVFLLRDSQALLKELPFTLKLIAKRIQSGNLNLKFQSEDLSQLAKDLDRASRRLSLALFLGAILMASSILTFGKQGKIFDSLASLGLFGFGIAAIVGFWLVISIIRSGRIS